MQLNIHYYYKFCSSNITNFRVFQVQNLGHSGSAEKRIMNLKYLNGGWLELNK